MWAKIKTYLCCGEEDETERPVFVIVSATAFSTMTRLTYSRYRASPSDSPYNANTLVERNEVILPGLTAEE